MPPTAFPPSRPRPPMRCRVCGLQHSHTEWAFTAHSTGSPPKTSARRCASALLRGVGAPIENHRLPWGLPARLVAVRCQEHHPVATRRQRTVHDPDRRQCETPTRTGLGASLSASRRTSCTR